MPDFLALEWDAHEISAVAAQVSRKSVNVRQVFVCRWPEKIDPVGNPRQAGDWLKEELARQGVEYQETLVALPRELVAIKPLEIPAVPDEELPDVVRLQAATRSAVPLDQLKVDFIPAPYVDGAQTRRVSLATFPKKAFERVQHLIESAGLQLAGVGMSPAATATVIALAAGKRPEVPNGVSLVVSRRGVRVETSLLRDRQILFSYASILHGETEEERNRTILVDVNRCLVAAENEGALHGQKVSHVWCLGNNGTNRALSDSLQRKFSCGVSSTLDPFTETGVEGAKANISGDSWSLAAPVGMLLSRAGLGVESVDFVNPHKPPEKKDHRKLRAAIIAAGVVLLVGWLFVDRQMTLAGLESRIEELNIEKAEIDGKLNKGKPELASAQTIEQWLDLKVDWVEQFNELRQNFKDANGIYLSDFRVTPPSRGEVAGIKATGYAQKEDDIRALYRRLYEHNYQANAYTIQKNESNPEYPFQFELNVELLRGRKALPPPKPIELEPKKAEGAAGSSDAKKEEKTEKSEKESNAETPAEETKAEEKKSEKAEEKADTKPATEQDTKSEASSNDTSEPTSEAVPAVESTKPLVEPKPEK